MSKMGLIRTTTLHVTLLLTSLAILAASSAASQAASQPTSASIALPHGHRIQRDKAAQLEIANRKGKKLISPIAGYAVYGSLVTGIEGIEIKISGAYPGDRPLPESKDAKYFVLDTKSGQMDAGLALDAWKAKLKQLGVNAPELREAMLP